MNERGSFVFYESYFDAIDELDTAESQMRVIGAIRRLALYGEEPDLAKYTATERIILKMAAPTVTANGARYDASRRGGRPSVDEAARRGIEDGLKGGRPQAELADEYGVSQATVSRIGAGRQERTVSDRPDYSKPVGNDYSKPSKEYSKPSFGYSKPNVNVNDNVNDNANVNEGGGGDSGEATGLSAKGAESPPPPRKAGAENPPSPPRSAPDPPEKRARFAKPTVSEVADYCAERGNGVDARAFCDFYESKGWLVGSSKMRDWRAAVRTWERRDGRYGRTAGAGPPKSDLSRKYDMGALVDGGGG